MEAPEPLSFVTIQDTNVLSFLENLSTPLSTPSGSSAIQDPSRLQMENLSQQISDAVVIDFNQIFSQLNPDVELIECLICYEQYFPAYTIELGCGHSYCDGCTNNFIITSLKEGNTSPKCPGCRLPLTEDDVRKGAGEEWVTRMRRYRLLQEHRDNPNAVYCPKAECGLPCVKNSPEELFVICTCGFDFCSSCLLPRHERKTCQEAVEGMDLEERRKKVELERRMMWASWATKIWVLWNTKKCPQCGEAIEKNGGCHHMTCKSCRFMFCWNCGGDWRKKHCIGRKAVLLTLLPVTIPTGVALAPVVGVFALGLLAAERLVEAAGLKRRDPDKGTWWVVKFLEFGWENCVKHLLEPFKDGWRART
eukprot:TRINITY_DN2019_c0_g1_i1.p1 TRINITY_DN2019_c0_g1~~TRINITY_DN2019_c0_g1_i1.p1  ORF type:complete len:364 (-),score=71.63 TRINITY_DN2019_c0_g1_i1:85-1176(-)